MRIELDFETIDGRPRAATTLPWTGAELRLYRTIVPQMVLWLPADEAAQVRFAFERELDRLQAA